MSTIHVQLPHNTESQVYREITDGGSLIVSDASAVTIASWWQSPGTIGHVLAGFASGAEVDRRALLEDIVATIADHAKRDPGDLLPLDLDALQMWVLNRTSYEYDFRNGGYSMVRRTGTDNEWRL